MMYWRVTRLLGYLRAKCYAKDGQLPRATVSLAMTILLGYTKLRQLV